MDFSGINPQTARMFLPLLQQIANSETAGLGNDLDLSHGSLLGEKRVSDSEDRYVDKQPSHFNAPSSSTNIPAGNDVVLHHCKLSSYWRS